MSGPGPQRPRAGAESTQSCTVVRSATLHQGRRRTIAGLCVIRTRRPNRSY